jgi:hypothetical protein
MLSIASSHLHGPASRHVHPPNPSPVVVAVGEVGGVAVAVGADHQVQLRTRIVAEPFEGDLRERPIPAATWVFGE